MSYSYRLRAWARQTLRLGGRHWAQVPAWWALSEGEQETVRMARKYRAGVGSDGRLDEHGDASEFAAKILSEGT